MLVEHVLLDAGFQVDVADTVAEAWALLDRKGPYDMVLTDGRLEDGTGMMVGEVARRMGIRVLIITGHAFDLPRDLLEFEFLLKPVRPGELIDAIRRVLAAPPA